MEETQIVKPILMTCWCVHQAHAGTPLGPAVDLTGVVAVDLAAALAVGLAGALAEILSEMTITLLGSVSKWN